MKQLNQFFRMKKRLEYQARCRGLDIAVKVIDYNEAHTAIEKSGTYSYPETLEIKIENKENWFYSIRFLDGRMIQDGSKLSGKGYSVAEVYATQLRQLNKWAKQIRLSKGA